MNKKLILLLQLGLLAFGCTNYKDQKLLVSEIKAESILSQKLNIAIIGKEKLKYKTQLSYNNEIILETEIESFQERTDTTLTFDFSSLEDKIFDISKDIIEKKIVDLKITAVNKEQRKILDTIISIQFRLPPISKVLKIDSDDIVLVHNNDFNKNILESKRYFNLKDDDLNYKIAFLTTMIKLKTFGINRTDTIPNIPKSKIYSLDKELEVSVYTDTTYSYSLLTRLRSSYFDIDEIIRKNINETPLDSISKTIRGKKVDSTFLFNRKINTSGTTGLISSYLININAFGDFTYIELGSYKVDGYKPIFENSKWCSEPDDPSIKGVVCIDNEHFYGYNPYNIPFIGRIYGDIKTLIVDGKSIPFKVGEELYFKKRVYLDGGYNRIPVIVIDHFGNKTESYIPITMEQID